MVTSATPARDLMSTTWQRSEPPAGMPGDEHQNPFEAKDLMSQQPVNEVALNLSAWEPVCACARFFCLLKKLTNY